VGYRPALGFSSAGPCSSRKEGPVAPDVRFQVSFPPTITFSFPFSPTPTLFSPLHHQTITVSIVVNLDFFCLFRFVDNFMFAALGRLPLDA
jgi:hypothetical protein